MTHEDSGGRTYYTLTSDKLSYEIDYVYVDGYLLAAPSRTLLNKAIQNRATGYVLSRSDAFRAQLPRRWSPELLRADLPQCRVGTGPDCQSTGSGTPPNAKHPGARGQRRSPA